MADRNICYLNESSELTDAQIAPWIAAYEEDFNQYAHLWGIGSVAVRQIPKGDPPLSGWEQQVFLDNSDQANALGHHDWTVEGLALGKTFVATTEQYGQTVSRVASHEGWEALVDPAINRYAPHASDGREYAIEVGDLLSLDSQGREGLGGVLLSGIALPATYYPNYGTQYDIGGMLSRPLPDVQPSEGAYLMWRGGAAWAPSILIPPAHGSRRHRRMMGLGNWKRSTVAVR